MRSRASAWRGLPKSRIPGRGVSARMRRRPKAERGLRYRHLFAQVYVLDRVEQGDTFVHRPLEGLPTRNESHATGPLVDDGRGDGIGEVAGALGFAATVDQTRAPHIT